jgi:hypothetical protein
MSPTCRRNGSVTFAGKSSETFASPAANVPCTPSGATVMLDAGMPKAAVISEAENAETVKTCAALLALRR